MQGSMPNSEIAPTLAARGSLAERLCQAMAREADTRVPLGIGENRNTSLASVDVLDDVHLISIALLVPHVRI